MLKKNTTLPRQPLLVLLYTLLYNAFSGFVTQPHPLGALNPKLWRMIRLTDVRAAIRLVSDGVRNPNFIFSGCKLIDFLLKYFHIKTPTVQILKQFHWLFAIRYSQ